MDFLCCNKLFARGCHGHSVKKVIRYLFDEEHIIAGKAVLNLSR